MPHKFFLKEKMSFARNKKDEKSIGKRKALFIVFLFFCSKITEHVFYDCHRTPA